MAVLPFVAPACDSASHRPGGHAPPDPAASHRHVERTYLTVAGRELRLDVYVPRAGPRPVPTVLFLHGGGWTQGNKEQVRRNLLPYLAAGWAAVTPDYRLAPGDLAPAAVEDAECALRWVGAHASEYGFDQRRIIVAGYSAGGHLALMLGLLPDSSLFSGNCPGAARPRPAAVVSFAGITDVGELLGGAARRDFAVTWIGARPDRDSVATVLSPLAWVRSGGVPVITAHGEADSLVPYRQAARLHQALDRAGVPNRLVTLRRVGHSFGSRAERHAMDEVTAFLRLQGITPIPAAGRASPGRAGDVRGRASDSLP
jgi:acetyl esterase/lipase